MGSYVLRITAVSLALLATTPVLAQEATNDTTRAVAVEDDGFNLGWLGLLGLLGLTGLRRREPDVLRTTAAPHM